MNFKKLSNANKAGVVLLVIGVLAGIIVGILFGTGVLGTSGVDIEQLGYDLAHYANKYYNALSTTKKDSITCVNESGRDGIIFSFLMDPDSDDLADTYCDAILKNLEPSGLKNNFQTMIPDAEKAFKAGNHDLQDLFIKGMDNYLETLTGPNKTAVKSLIGYENIKRV